MTTARSKYTNKATLVRQHGSSVLVQWCGGGAMAKEDWRGEKDSFIFSTYKNQKTDDGFLLLQGCSCSQPVGEEEKKGNLDSIAPARQQKHHNITRKRNQ